MAADFCILAISDERMEDAKLYLKSTFSTYHEDDWRDGYYQVVRTDLGRDATEEELDQLDEALTKGDKPPFEYSQREVILPAYDRNGLLYNAPRVWVCEVSWLKAAIMDDYDKYVPGVAGKIAEIISNKLPLIDDELIAQVSAAFDMPNTSIYTTDERTRDKVARFLKQHKGKHTITVGF